MTKVEFSVNELEPERNTNEVVEETTQMEYTEESDATYLNQVAVSNDEKKHDENVNHDVVIDENQGPTIKELIVNSVNPDYQGPTAREIVVNSVKVDNTKKKNIVGLFVLILVIVLVGIIGCLEVFSEDKKEEVNYLDNLPSWSLEFNEYFNENYDDLIAYDLAFIDFDGDDQAEALINYEVDDKIIYEIIDLLGDDSERIILDNVKDILFMYSFDLCDVVWYLNTSLDEYNLELINVKKRLENAEVFDLYLSNDQISEFKSSHFALSYEINYVRVGYRTYEENFANAVEVYSFESRNIKAMTDKAINQYNDVM